MNSRFTRLKEYEEVILKLFVGPEHKNMLFIYEQAVDVSKKHESPIIVFFFQTPKFHVSDSVVFIFASMKYFFVNCHVSADMPLKHG